MLVLQRALFVENNLLHMYLFALLIHVIHQIYKNHYTGVCHGIGLQNEWGDASALVKKINMEQMKY